MECANFSQLATVILCDKCHTFEGQVSPNILFSPKPWITISFPWKRYNEEGREWWRYWHISCCSAVVATDRYRERNVRIPHTPRLCATTGILLRTGSSLKFHQTYSKLLSPKPWMTTVFHGRDRAKREESDGDIGKLAVEDRWRVRTRWRCRRCRRRPPPPPRRPRPSPTSRRRWVQFLIAAKPRRSMSDCYQF